MSGSSEAGDVQREQIETVLDRPELSDEQCGALIAHIFAARNQQARQMEAVRAWFSRVVASPTDVAAQKEEK